jgi:hypothetical protein
MSLGHPQSTPPEGLETDDRFPSGPWTGFFLQRPIPGRSWMELDLTFQKGMIRGEGRDKVGEFVIRGRYDVETGKCSWSKRYVGKHDIAYLGFNEGKGIWGTWEWPPMPSHRGGFHIWPVAMGDPTQNRLAAEADVPESVEAETAAPVGAPA